MKQFKREKVRDEELLAMIEQGVMNSVGDFLNSSCNIVFSIIIINYSITCNKR